MVMTTRCGLAPTWTVCPTEKLWACAALVSGHRYLITGITGQTLGSSRSPAKKNSLDILRRIGYRSLDDWAGARRQTRTERGFRRRKPIPPREIDSGPDREGPATDRE